MASARQLLIVAEVMAPVFVPAGAIHLDALLASAVARRDGLPPPLDPTTMVRVEIPIERSPCGRVHMCSSSIFGVECRETQYTNRRPPIAEYQTMGNERMRRVDIATGPNKGYRIPRPVCHLMADEVRWYAQGDADAIRALLETVTHIGKRRSVGLGRVRSWSVTECAGWDGAPVVRDGKPLRPLPSDWPGLVEPRLTFGNLSYPYWDHSTEHLIAVPL